MIDKLIEELEEMRDKYGGGNTKEEAIHSSGIQVGLHKAIEKAKALQQKVRCENCNNYDPDCPCEVANTKTAYCHGWKEKRE
jgi:hypothetical protein